jgi:hypothetical protein
VTTLIDETTTDRTLEWREMAQTRRRRRERERDLGLAVRGGLSDACGADEVVDATPKAVQGHVSGTEMAMYRVAHRRVRGVTSAAASEAEALGA